MENKVEYIRCPRCELNYINKKDKLCKVCEAELASKGNREVTDEEAKEMNLCPICKKNYLIDDEEICSECAIEKSLLEETRNLSEDDQSFDNDERTENWRQYVENDDAELPEDEFGDMTSITTEDDVLDEEDINLDDEEFDEEFEDELKDEFEDEFNDDFDEEYDDEDELDDEKDFDDEDDFDDDDSEYDEDDDK